jgi:uncharacterized protein DUF4190
MFGRLGVADHHPVDTSKGLPGAVHPGHNPQNWAIVSAVTAVLGVFPIAIFSLIAIVFGYKARSEIRTGGGPGKALAGIGIVVGWLGMAWSAFVGTLLYWFGRCFMSYEPGCSGNGPVTMLVVVGFVLLGAGIAIEVVFAWTGQRR